MTGMTLTMVGSAVDELFSGELSAREELVAEVVILDKEKKKKICDFRVRSLALIPCKQS